MGGMVTGAIACATVGLLATGAGYESAVIQHAPLLVGAATTFGSVFGNWTYDRAKDWVHAIRERPGLPTDENHVITRALRSLQIECTEEIASEWREGTAGDPNPAHQAEIRAFDAWLKTYLKHAKQAAQTLLVQDMPELDAADRQAIGEMEAHWPGQALQAGLAGRHGDPEALGGWSWGATLLILAELRQAYGAEPPRSFVTHMIGSDPRASRWFDRFIRRAAAKLSKDQDLRNRWETEQQAVILSLGKRTSENVTALVAAIPTITQVLTDLGTRLDAVAGDVQAIGTVVRQMDAALHDVRSWLSFEERSCEGLLRFASWNPAIPFVGREKEMAALQSFLDEGEEPFLWWIVTGPGGAGKTRLARELCLRAYAQGWRVGFLEDKPPDLWQPSGKLLIIADYAGGKMDMVRSVALRLRRLCATTPVRLRLLLIERVADQVFWDRFFGTGHSDEGALKKTRHSKDAVAVPDLAEDALWALLRPRPWMEQPTPLRLDRATFFERLTKVDHQKRALVAMILAEAEEAGMAGSLEALLRKLIKTTRDKHRLPDTPDDAPVLISAATMAGCLEGDLLAGVDQAIGRFVTGEELDLCAHAMGGSSAPDARRLLGIQPDLVGEFFVLETLVGDRRDPSGYPWLARAVWRHAAQAMEAFSFRAVQNFAAHPAIALLMDPPVEIEESMVWFSVFAWTASAVSLPNLPWALRERWIDLVQRTVSAFPDTVGFRVALGSILFGTLNHAKDEGNLSRRDALLQELQHLARDWPEDAAVREWLAKSLVNTIAYAKEEGDIARRDALLQEVRDLARVWPEDAAVREELAKGLFYTLIDAKEEGNLPRRDALLKELRTLAGDWAEDAAVRENLAMSLVNTLIDAKEEGDIARRDALLQEVRDLARVWPEDAAVREALAKGLFNTLNDAKEEGNLPRRDALLEELRALARDWPEDAAVRARLAKGLYNTLIDAEAQGNLPRRDPLLQELRDLATAWPEDAAVREQLAAGLGFCAIWCAELGDTVGRDAYRAEFDALVATWPENATLQHLADLLRRALDRE